VSAKPATSKLVGIFEKTERNKCEVTMFSQKYSLLVEGA
jgi:hypothetical protein